MKTKVNCPSLPLATLMAAFLTATGIAAVAAEPADEFQYLNSRNSTILYYRWIKVTDDLQVRQIRGVITVDQPPAEVIRCLQDEKSTVKWMQAVEDYHHLQKTDEENWKSYIRFSVSWPLKDQDCILGYHMKKNANGTTEISFISEPGYIKEVKNVKRISNMEGSWVISPAPGGKTRVVYTVVSKNAPSYPRWITDPIIQNNLLTTLESLRSLLNR